LKGISSSNNESVANSISNYGGKFYRLADCARILCKLKKNETYDNIIHFFKVIQYFKTREILAGKKD
jgi:hypothetical protein